MSRAIDAIVKAVILLGIAAILLYILFDPSNVLYDQNRAEKLNKMGIELREKQIKRGVYYSANPESNLESKYFKYIGPPQ